MLWPRRLWRSLGTVYLLIFKSFPGFLTQQVPTSPRLVRFSRGLSVFRGARFRKVSGSAGPWRRAAVPGPRFAGRLEGGTGAPLWFTCARPKTTSRIGSGTGRRRLHPGAGARHLVHFVVPPPGFGLLSRAVRGGRSIPLGGPCPGLLGYLRAVSLADGVSRCPTDHLAFRDGAAYLSWLFRNSSIRSVSRSQSLSWLASSGMPSRS